MFSKTQNSRPKRTKRVTTSQDWPTSRLVYIVGGALAIVSVFLTMVLKGNTNAENIDPVTMWETNIPLSIITIAGGVLAFISGLIESRIPKIISTVVTTVMMVVWLAISSKIMETAPEGATIAAAFIMIIIAAALLIIGVLLEFAGQKDE